MIMCLYNCLHASPVATTHSHPLANKTTNRDWYRDQVNKQLVLGTCFSTANDVDAAAANFSSVLQTSVRSCSTFREKLPEAISYPLSIRKLVQQRRQARKKWQKLHTLENKKLFNKLARQITRAI